MGGGAKKMKKVFCKSASELNFTTNSGLGEPASLSQFFCVSVSPLTVTSRTYWGDRGTCEIVLAKELELEATELNLKNNNQKVHTPALVYNWNGSKSAHNM